MKIIMYLIIMLMMFNLALTQQNKAIIRYSNGIIKETIDNGNSWKVTLPNPNAKFYRNGTLKSTTDMGKSWILGNGLQNQTVIAYSNGIKKITYDYGKTWSILTEQASKDKINLMFEFHSNFINIHIVSKNESSLEGLFFLTDINGCILKNLGLNGLVNNNEIILYVEDYSSGTYILTYSDLLNKVSKVFPIIH